MNKRELQALTLMGPTVTRSVPDPLAVLSLYIIYKRNVYQIKMLSILLEKTRELSFGRDDTGLEIEKNHIDLLCIDLNNISECEQLCA